MAKNYKALRYYEDPPVDKDRLNAALLFCTPSVQTLVEREIRAVDEARAADAAGYERGQTLRSNLDEAKRQQALHQRELDRQPKISSDDKRRAKQLLAAVKREQLRLDDFTVERAKKPRALKMRLSRIQAYIANKVRTPQRPIQIKVPQNYRSADPAEAIQRIRDMLAALRTRRDMAIDAPLTFEDALRRFEAAWRRKRDGADAPWKEFYRVREADDGRLREHVIDIPDAVVWRAIEPHLLAYAKRRLQDVAEGFEFDNVRATTMRDRKSAIGKIDAEITSWEMLEGHFLRELAVHGRDFHIRPEMSIAALLGQEPDPDATEEEADEAA